MSEQDLFNRLVGKVTKRQIELLTELHFHIHPECNRDENCENLVDFLNTDIDSYRIDLDNGSTYKLDYAFYERFLVNYMPKYGMKYPE